MPTNIQSLFKFLQSWPKDHVWTFVATSLKHLFIYEFTCLFQFPHSDFANCCAMELSNMFLYLLHFLQIVLCASHWEALHVCFPLTVMGE